MVKPSVEGIALMLTVLTGKDVTPEELTRLAERAESDGRTQV